MCRFPICVAPGLISRSSVLLAGTLDDDFLLYGIINPLGIEANVVVPVSLAFSTRVYTPQKSSKTHTKNQNSMGLRGGPLLQIPSNFWIPNSRRPHPSCFFAFDGYVLVPCWQSATPRRRPFSADLASGPAFSLSAALVPRSRSNTHNNNINNFP